MAQKELFRIIVGLMILASVALTIFVSRRWLLFTVFIGANMVQSVYTGFCPMDMMLRLGGRPETKATGGPAGPRV